MSIIAKIYNKIFPAVISSNSIIKDWENAGKPLPPPHLVKQQAIHSLQSKFGYQVLIETGTYLGDMVEAQKNNFAQVYSIELGEDLHRDAVKRFENEKNVCILQGDSSDVLITLCKKIDKPAIFWLDGHYSAGITALGKKQCPIYEELTAIFDSETRGHLLLIDDARLFVGKDDYPTIAELEDFIKRSRPNATIHIEDDIINVFLNDKPVQSK
jgi:hypothetical protein